MYIIVVIRVDGVRVFFKAYINIHKANLSSLKTYYSTQYIIAWSRKKKERIIRFLVN